MGKKAMWEETRWGGSRLHVGPLTLGTHWQSKGWTYSIRPIEFEGKGHASFESELAAKNAAEAHVKKILNELLGLLA